MVLTNNLFLVKRRWVKTGRGWQGLLKFLDMALAFSEHNISKDLDDSHMVDILKSSSSPEERVSMKARKWPLASWIVQMRPVIVDSHRKNRYCVRWKILERCFAVVCGVCFSFIV